MRINIRIMAFIGTIGLIASCSQSAKKDTKSRLVKSEQPAKQNLDDVFLAEATSSIRLHMAAEGVSANEIDEIVVAVTNQFKNANLGFNLNKNQKMRDQFNAIFGAVLASKANSLGSFDRALSAASKVVTAISGKSNETQKFETSVFDTITTLFPGVASLKTFEEVKANAKDIKSLIASAPAPTPTPGQFEIIVAELLADIEECDSCPLD